MWPFAFPSRVIHSVVFGTQKDARRCYMPRGHLSSDALTSLAVAVCLHMHQDGIIDELEGQVEMLAQQLRSKDRHPFAVDATRESEARDPAWLEDCAHVWP